MKIYASPYCVWRAHLALIDQRLVLLRLGREAAVAHDLTLRVALYQARPGRDTRCRAPSLEQGLVAVVVVWEVDL